MKVLVGTAVLMSALATGGIPVVMSTVAQTDAAVEQIRAEQSVRAGAADDRTDAPSDDASEGPSEGASEGAADDAAEEAAELAERLAERAEAREKRADKDNARRAGRDTSAGKPGYGPPEHARSIHNRGGSMPGRSGSNDPRLGRLHGKAMRAWAACVSEQPGRDAERFDPEAACGEKPTPPGHLKHGPASPER